MKLYRLPLSLNQTLIHTGHEDVSNTVVAFVDEFKKLIVIRPTFRDSQKLIQEFTIMYIDDNAGEFEVVYGDGFQVDTWDKKTEKSQVKLAISSRKSSGFDFNSLEN